MFPYHAESVIVQDILEPLTQDELLAFVRTLERSNSRLIREMYRVPQFDELIKDMWPFYRVATWLMKNGT